MTKVIRSSAALVALSILTAGTIWSADRVDPVNKDRQSLALKGYDPVAYFKQGRPVKGTPDFTYQWLGATWRFSSAESRDLFAASPKDYVPQYGGYCAWAVSRGYTADVDPEAWKIVDGALYLNYSKDVRRNWEADIPGNIRKADVNWPNLHR